MFRFANPQYLWLLLLFAEFLFANLVLKRIP